MHMQIDGTPDLDNLAPLGTGLWIAIANSGQNANYVTSFKNVVFTSNWLHVNLSRP